MRKILLGLVATAAIASPLALATSAQAATSLSTYPACTPDTEVIGVTEVNHPEYKYVLADGTAGHVQCSTESATDRDFGGVKYVAEYNRQGQHKTLTVIDTPAVQAVDGVTCVIPLPVNPLTDASVIDGFVAPADTDKFTWGTLTDHSLLNGKVGIKVTAEPRLRVRVRQQHPDLQGVRAGRVHAAPGQPAHRPDPRDRRVLRGPDHSRCRLVVAR